LSENRRGEFFLTHTVCHIPCKKETELLKSFAGLSLHELISISQVLSQNYSLDSGVLDSGVFLFSGYCWCCAWSWTG